jgi:hypothetical protein
VTKALQTLAFTTAFAFATTAAQAETLTFSRDGLDYRAEITERADGATLISGKVVTTGQRFNLVVQNGEVLGRFGRSNVAFAVPAVPQSETLLSSR